MYDFTRQLYEESRTDKIRLIQVNNSKDRNRTEEQRTQSTIDKCKYVAEKYDCLYNNATTETQKEICLDMINRASVILNKLKERC